MMPWELSGPGYGRRTAPGQRCGRRWGPLSDHCNCNRLWVWGGSAVGVGRGIYVTVLGPWRRSRCVCVWVGQVDVFPSTCCAPEPDGEGG